MRGQSFGCSLSVNEQWHSESVANAPAAKGLTASHEGSTPTLDSTLPASSFVPSTSTCCGRRCGRRQTPAPVRNRRGASPRIDAVGKNATVPFRPSGFWHFGCDGSKNSANLAPVSRQRVISLGRCRCSLLKRRSDPFRGMAALLVPRAKETIGVLVGSPSRRPGDGTPM